MKVALIFNPFAYKLHEENLRIVQRYFGLFPPLSLGGGNCPTRVPRAAPAGPP